MSIWYFMLILAYLALGGGLTLLVLAQRPAGGGLSDACGGRARRATSSVFGGRVCDVMTGATVIIAVCFILSAIALAGIRPA